MNIFQENNQQQVCQEIITCSFCNFLLAVRHLPRDLAVNQSIISASRFNYQAAFVIIKSV